MSRMGRTERTSRTVNIIYTVGGHRGAAQAAIVPRRGPRHPALRRRRRCRRLYLGGGPPSRPKYVGACAAQQPLGGRARHPALRSAHMTVGCLCSHVVISISASDRRSSGATPLMQPHDGHLAGAPQNQRRNCRLGSRQKTPSTQCRCPLWLDVASFVTSRISASVQPT